MKTHALKMSVAFLCTLFVLACDETRQQAVTGLGDSPQLFGPKNCVPGDPRPSCNGGGGGGGTSEDADVTTTGGMVTPAGEPQAVQVKKDNENQLKLQSSGAKGATASKNPTFEVEISLTGTKAEADLLASACEGDFIVKDKLIDGSKLRDFYMAIAGLDVDETGAGVLNVVWRPLPDQSFGVRVGTHEALAVKRLPDPGIGVRRFKFLTVDDAPLSIVSVSLVTEKPKTFSRLNCPTKDAIIVDVELR